MKIHIPAKIIGDYKKFMQYTMKIGLEAGNEAEFNNMLELEGKKYLMSLKVRREK